MHRHDLDQEEPHSRRDQSSPRKGSGGPAKRQNSRGSNPPGKRGGAHSGGRKPLHGRKTLQDENLGITTVLEPGLAKEAQEQEVRSLRFELQ